MMRRLRTILFLQLILIISCSEAENNAVNVCRNIYQSVLSKADITFIPKLSTTKNTKDYVEFVSNNLEDLRQCMSGSVEYSSKEETSNWIRMSVGLGSLKIKWEYVNKNPEGFLSVNQNKIFFENAI